MPSVKTSLLRRRRPALAAMTAVALCAAPLAGAGAASAATGPAAATPSPSLITFDIKQPAGSEAFVHFTGGLGSITEQAIVGSALLGDTTTPNSFSISSLGANTATDYLQGATTPGTPITGTATLPAGTSVTASINGGPSVAIPNGSFSIPVASGLGATAGAIPSIHVSPHAARPGAKVRIYGIAPTGSRTGATLTLMSTAFSSTHRVSRMPAVTTRVGADGSYSATTQIARATKPSTYGVTGKVGNRYLQVAALKVRG